MSAVAPLLALALIAPLTGVPAVPAPAAANPAAESKSYVAFRDAPGRFPIVARGRAATIVVSTADHAGVIRAADDVQSDLTAVTGVQPEVVHDHVPSGAEPVIIGTLGKSPLIDRIVARGKLDVRGLRGRWETTIEQVVSDPLPGVRRAFVIAGSDQRGTIYGAYDLSRAIGVSPWHFWDDVPAARHDS